MFLTKSFYNVYIYKLRCRRNVFCALKAFVFFFIIVTTAVVAQFSAFLSCSWSTSGIWWEIYLNLVNFVVLVYVPTFSVVSCSSTTEFHKNIPTTTHNIILYRFFSVCSVVCSFIIILFLYFSLQTLLKYAKKGIWTRLFAVVFFLY